MATVLGNRYRLEEPVGSGGMGSVWGAVDQVLGRSVAVKVVDLATVVEPATEQRFQREVQVTAALAHPNIVTVFDAGIDGRTLFLVMERLAGPSLAEVVHRHAPLPADRVVGYGRQMCAGLAAAHAAGVVHRDLKPANAVFSAGSVLKLVDFGIARTVAATTQADLTAPSTVVGTPGYVSPEQAKGGVVDARSDLYALGCVLFALLTGHPPFSGDTPLQTLSQHVHAPVPDLAALRPDIPPALAGAVTALLAKDPEARPAGAADADGLLAATLGPPTAWNPEPSPTAVEPAPVAGWAPAPTPTAVEGTPAPTAVLADEEPADRRKVLALAAAAVVVAGLLAWWALSSGGSATKPPPSTTSTTAPTSTTTAPTTSTTITTTTTVPTTVTHPTAPPATKPQPGHGPASPPPGGGGGGHGHGNDNGND